MNSKICTKCGKEKRIDCFDKSKGRYEYRCKDCRRIQQKENWKIKYMDSENKKRRSEQVKKWRKENPESWYYSRLARKFGMSKNSFSEWYRKSWKIQKGRCCICNIKLIKHGQNTHVDHCHLKIQLRGILCSKCNLGIGLLKDSPEACLKAAAYLKKFN